MRKALAIMLGASMVFGLAACMKPEPPSEKDLQKKLEDEFDGEFEIFFLGKMPDQNVVFVKVSEDSPQKSDNGRGKQPNLKLELTCTFGAFTRKLFRGGPVNDENVENNKGDNCDLFNAFLLKNTLFIFRFLGHKTIILERNQKI